MRLFFYFVVFSCTFYMELRLFFLLREKNASTRFSAALLTAVSMTLFPVLMQEGLRTELSFWQPLFAFSGFLFSFGIYAFASLVLRDGVCALYSLAVKKNRFSISRREAVPVLGAAALLAGTGVCKTEKFPETHTVRVRIQNLPKELEGLRIAHLTDLHISPLFPEDRVKRIAEKVNALSPDFIAITGDIADGLPEVRSGALFALKELHAKHGVFMVPGNHEYYVDYEAWKTFYEKLGMPLYENVRRTFEIRGKRVTFVMLSDRTARQRGFEGPDPEKALADAPADDLRIALVHRPDELSVQDPRHGIRLQLSGHTHGGQLCFLNPLIRQQNHGFLKGLYKRNETQVYVSPGIGLWAGIPGRIGADPEISLIELECA